jgi:hypothetical protein
MTVKSSVAKRREIFDDQYGAHRYWGPSAGGSSTPTIMRLLPSGQAEPDREPLRIDDGMDFAREPAALIDRSNNLDPIQWVNSRNRASVGHSLGWLLKADYTP